MSDSELSSDTKNVSDLFINYVNTYYSSISSLLTFIMIDLMSLISVEKARNFPIYSLCMSATDKPLFFVSYINLFDDKYKNVNHLVKSIPDSIMKNRAHRLIIRGSHIKPIEFITINSEQWRSLYDDIIMRLNE